ncbi:ribonuclease H-like domain, reverse transcriptase, RNA-dependent DNA polymerase [Tanacetum coccineum]
MMKATNLPQNFWAEAVRHAIYILNSVSTKALEDITPYEVIKRRKPNLENLRVFGCIAYAKVPSQHLTKLDDRSSRMVYLGNELGSKAYRLFDPTTQKIFVSRDVKFKENETWDWKEYMSEHINDEPEWTDFKIENLEATYEHHDQETQPSEEDNEFPNNDDDGYASPTTNSPSHSQTPHTPSTRSSPVNFQVTPNTSTQSFYQSDSGSISTTNSHSHFDHTPLRGYRTLNDLIITGTPKKEIDKFKAQMEEKFEMSDLGLLAYYLGIEVTQTGGNISIKQSAYANKILKEAGMIDCNKTLIPMDPGTRLTKNIEGTLVNSTKYQIVQGQEPKEQHMKAIRQVLRYVKGKKDYGITYKHNGGNKIHGFSDSSYRDNTQEGKRTTGIIFYYATAAATQALWLKRLLSKLTHSQEEKVTIMIDNKSIIALMKDPVFHGRSKHIDTKYHFIRECVEREDIQVEFVSEEYQKADILTKALPKIKFLTMRQLIGLKDLQQNDCD